MIESIMFVALGFLLAGLVALLLTPPLWRRAVRLTTRRLEATMPMTVADIQADKDHQRAEFAVQLRQMEMAYEKAREKAARHLVERNRGRAQADELKAEIDALLKKDSPDVQTGDSNHLSDLAKRLKQANPLQWEAKKRKSYLSLIAKLEALLNEAT